MFFLKSNINILQKNDTGIETNSDSIKIHLECARCSECNTKLSSDETFFVVDGVNKIKCINCSKINSRKCAKCNQNFKSTKDGDQISTQIITNDFGSFHPDCFKCKKCGTNQMNEFTAKNDNIDEIYCM